MGIAVPFLGSREYIPRAEPPFVVRYTRPRWYLPPLTFGRGGVVSTLRVWCERGKFSSLSFNAKGQITVPHMYPH